MLLTKCASCAAELGLTSGKKCGRCATRYCGPACQKKHWEEGGHDKLCRKIKKAGGAEQYHANKKYAESVTIAAEACAEDTKGQTCYICTQALHWKTKEGLVRGCACRGTAGFAHVSCLAEQAKILYAEAEDADAPLDDVREAVTTLDGTVRIARRVLGGDHPTVSTMEGDLEGARAALRFRESGDVESIREAVEAMTAGDA